MRFRRCTFDISIKPECGAKFIQCLLRATGHKCNVVIDTTSLLEPTNSAASSCDGNDKSKGFHVAKCAISDNRDNVLWRHPPTKWLCQVWLNKKCRGSTNLRRQAITLYIYLVTKHDMEHISTLSYRCRHFRPPLECGLTGSAIHIPLPHQRGAFWIVCRHFCTTLMLWQASVWIHVVVVLWLEIPRIAS